ncbi:MAG: hypothetical protein L3J06_03370 [Cyclobacteriaceae bacterium]|nr:hypothetical protein [Cyclobacteriaceae bacterium]
MEIIWSDDAKLDYDENIEYLLKEWSEKSAANFKRSGSSLETTENKSKLFPQE